MINIIILVALVKMFFHEQNKPISRQNFIYKLITRTNNSHDGINNN